MSAEAKTAATRWPPRCAANPALHAAAFCTVCGLPFSGGFLTSRDDGRAICHRCVRETDVPVVETRTTSVTDPVLDDGWRAAFLSVVVHPHSTFSKAYDGPIFPAIRFGFICILLSLAMWLGYSLAFDAETLMETFSARLAETDYAGADAEQTFRRVAWLSLPIWSAVLLGVCATLLHVGARLAGAPRGSFGEHARAFALCCVGLLFCVIPKFGPYVAMIIWLSSTLAFLRSRYHFGLARSLFAILPCALVFAQLWPI